MIERQTTLTCVSNEVGGDLIGNQVWLGHPIRELLARAKPTQDADMVLSTSIDGFTAGTPLEALTDDNRDALLAVAMGGEPLPVEHGFPVRMVVPGLYGYVSATKWVVDLEVTRFDQAEGYWTPRGWSAHGPIKTGSRIDVPAGQGEGRARSPWPGSPGRSTAGIERVEVRVDEGAWAAGPARRGRHRGHLEAVGLRVGREPRQAHPAGAGHGRPGRRPDRRRGQPGAGRRHRLAHRQRHRQPEPGPALEVSSEPSPRSS